MIYCDPTEIRDGTRLPAEIVEIAKPLVGLEAATGADLLISREGLEGRDVTKMPWKMKLKEFLQDGTLVQRKTDGDLTGSIPHLSSIFQRMQLATEGTNCWIWLLTVGVFTPSHDGNVTYKGVRFDQQTSWHWNALQGATDMWQLRGGLVHSEPNDAHAASWLQRWDKNLPKLQSEMEKSLGPRAKSRLEGGKIDPKPWRLTLESFPGVGSELSWRIAEHCDRLIDALCWMTWGTDGPKVQGVGKSALERWRKWLGLQEGEVLVVMPESGKSQPGSQDQLIIEEMERNLRS